MLTTDDGGSTLPNGFLETEYITANGAQYILIGTDRFLSDSPGFYIEFLISRRNYDNPYGPHILSSNDSKFLWLSARSINGTMLAYKGEENTYSPIFPLNERIVAQFNVSNDLLFSVPGYIDSQIVSAGSGTPSALYVGTYGGGPNQGIYRLIGNIYKLELYSGGVKALDLFPCVRQSDQTAGLYDVLNGVFYKSDTATNFTPGPYVS